MNDQLKILLIFIHKFCIVFFLFMFKAISQNYADFTPNSAGNAAKVCKFILGLLSLILLFSVLEILASWSTVLLLISGHRVPLNQVQMREALCSPAVQISSFTTRSVWSSAHNWAPESPWLLWPRSSRSICASMPGRSSLGTCQSESSIWLVLFSFFLPFYCSSLIILVTGAFIWGVILWWCWRGERVIISVWSHLRGFSLLLFKGRKIPTRRLVWFTPYCLWEFQKRSLFWRSCLVVSMQSFLCFF